MTEALEGKKVLVVDDEPDILESLSELLDMCETDQARDFETAARLIKENSYDAAVLDIMGVDGYNLLQLARYKNLPALMLTAQALSPNHLLKSIKEGAFAYIPKDKMVDIAFYLDEMIQAKLKNDRKSQNWFNNLSPVFDKEFGSDWRIQHRSALIDLELTHTREELEEIL